MTTTREDLRPCFRKLPKPLILALAILYLPLLLVSCTFLGVVLGFVAGVDIWINDVRGAWNLEAGNDK